MNHRKRTRRRSRRPQVPHLDEQIVLDDEALDIATGMVLVADASLRRLSLRIRQAQAELRAVVDDNAWGTYLHLESILNERAADAALVLTRWAFAEGIRCGRAAPRR